MAMGTTEPKDITCVVVGTGGTGSLVMRADFLEAIEVILRESTAISCTQYIPGLIDCSAYSPEVYFIPDGPNKIQKTTARGLELFGQRFRGKRNVQKMHFYHKIPAHQDRLRNKRKAWLRSLE